jgi:hypothetical protein
MTLSNHAKLRMIQRNKKAADLSPKQLLALLPTAEVQKKDDAVFYILKELDLVLVVNPLNQVVVTAYNFSSAKALQ